MGLFSIGALAIAEGGANAVGAVRLTCAPDALEVELVRAAPFARGFAPGAVAEDMTFRAPYTAVRGLVRDRRSLRLAFDPRLVTPHNRFTLARFSTDPALVLAGAYAARVRARIASIVVPAPLGLAVALAAPASLVSGVVGRGAVGLLVAGVVAIALREVVASLTWGGLASDVYRNGFEAELSKKLGLVPAHVEVEVPVDLGGLEHGDDDEDAPVAPRAARPRTAMIAAAIAAAFIGAMALFRQVTELEPPRAEPDVPAAAPAPTAPPVTDDGRAKLPSCVCLRADSPLWQAGLPAVAVLPFERADDGASEPKPTLEPNGRGRYAFEVAAVNDAAKPLHDVKVTMTFARRSKKGKRVGATDRGLFWEGALAPGHAVKWRVKAPGTEMKLEAGVADAACKSEGSSSTCNGIATLEQLGLEPAPADAAFDLTRSPYRAVRLQGAKLLAYERDPRAADVVASLAAGAPPGEKPILDELARASAPLITCAIAVDADASEERGEPAASACVFNGSAATQSGIRLRDSSQGAEIAVEGGIPAHEGVRVTWKAQRPPGLVTVRSH